MKILVTGGSGYLGTHVRRAFQADDFSRRSGFNILSSDDLKLIFEYDVVVHLAAYLNKDPAAAELCFQTNAVGTENVIKNMRPGSTLIYASTKDVYGANAEGYSEVPEDCPTHYCGQTALEWSKLSGEAYVQYYARRQNIRACIFRMSTVYARPSDGNEYGFVTHYVESVKHKRPIHLPQGGDAIRDILHVGDLVSACRAFLDSSREFGLYNLGGGKKNSSDLRSLVETVGELIELKPEIVDDASLPRPVPLAYVSDLTRIRTELNWKPKVTLKEGLQSLL